VIVLGIGYSQRLAAGAIVLIAMSLRAAVARVERWSAR
jgi:hypothetical protein